MRIKTNQKGKANRRKREEKQQQLQLIIIRIEPRKKGEKVAGKKSIRMLAANPASPAAESRSISRGNVRVD